MRRKSNRKVVATGVVRNPRLPVRISLFVLLLAAVSGVHAAWHDTDWRYRKPITIDSTLVDADLSQFAVLIHLPADAERGT